MKSIMMIVLLAVLGGLAAMSPIAVSWESTLYDQRMVWWVERHPRSAEIVLIGLDQPPEDAVCGSFSTRKQRTPDTPLAGMLEALNKLSPKAVTLAFHLPDCEDLKHLGATLAPLRNQGIPLVLIPPKQTAGESNIPRTLLLQSLHLEDDPDWYRVRLGDTLSMIAQRFQTTVATLKAFNRLSGTTIHPGQRLRVGRSGDEASPSPPTRHRTAIGSLQVKPHAAQDGVVRTVAWPASGMPPIGAVLADLLTSPRDEHATIRARGGDSENRLVHMAFSEPWDEATKPFHYQALSHFAALDHEAKTALIADKIVILFDATEEMQVRTPRDELVPRAYIQAQLLLNLMTGESVRTVPLWLTVCLVLLGSVATVSLYQLKGYRRRSDQTPALIWLYPLGWALLLALLYGFGLYGAFRTAQVMLPVIPPLVAIGLTAIGVAVLTWQQSVARLAYRMECLQSERDVMLDERARLLEKAEGNAEELAKVNIELAEKEAAILLLKVQQDQQKEIQRQFLPHTTALPPLSDADLAGLAQQAADKGICTRDPKMLEAFRKIQQLAPMPVPVCIQGETGTGKELYARAVHELSDRAQGPFEIINMGELKGEKLLARLFGQEKGGFTGIESRTGLFERANHGTLFLDEIANLDLEGQQQLLRVIEHGIVTPLGGKASSATDVRIVVATNQNLSKACAASTFMQDLYYRLTRGGTITLPPVRKRIPSDRQLLAETFIEHHCRNMGRASIPRLTEDALEWIQAQPWYGNVRELDGVVFRSLMLASDSPTIQRRHLSESVETDPFAAPFEEPEPAAAPALPTDTDGPDRLGDDDFVELLCQYQGTIQEVADHLGLHRDRVSLRVKGLALEAMFQGEGHNHEQSCERLLRGHAITRTGRRKLEKKMQGYWNTVVNTCRDWSSPDEAIVALWQANENMPARKHYLRDLDAFIRRHFPSLTQP